MPNSYCVAILSYNHPDLTSKTVESVLAKNPLLPVFLIHNGSDPKNVSSLKIKYPEVKHLALEMNKGYSGGANFGFAEIFKNHSRVLFLTNDTEAINLPLQFPNHLDFFSIKILKRNSENVDSVMGAVNLTNGRLMHLKSNHDFPVGQKSLKPYIPGTAFGLTKKAYNSLLGFDESLHTYWEDVELSLRAFAQKDLHCGYSELFTVKHKIGKTCHKNRFYTLYLFQRNRRRIMKKYGHSRLKFFLTYSYDLLKIFFKILKAENRRPHLLLLWNAIHD